MEKISVVIPMYNSQETILKALESVINQSRYDLIDEIIVVDDGSTDDSFVIVSKFKEERKCEKIKLLHQKNQGASSARNLGIKSASHNFIALLDADDVWLDNKIEIQSNILLQNPFIKALGTNRKDEDIKYGEKIDTNLYKINPFQYCIKNWPCTPSIIFDKRVFNENSFFEESMTHAEEGLFFLYLSVNVGLYYCSMPLVYCGDGKPVFGHSGLSGNLMKMHKGINKMLKEACQKKYISKIQYIFLRIYENMKYVRRKILNMLNK